MKEGNLENTCYSVFVNRMFMRNNSLKASLIMAVVMSLFMYGVMAFLYLVLDGREAKISYQFTSIQLIYNGAATFFASFFAYMSSFHVDLEIKKVDPRRLLIVVYRKFLWFSLFVYLLPIFVFYQKNEILFVLLETALFYMGIGVFLNLYISAYTTQYLSIYARKVDEVKSKNIINGYFLIPWLVMGLILVVEWLLIKVTSPLIGHSIVLVIEIGFIATFRIWINVVLRIFRKNRYKKMELYLSM